MVDARRCISHASAGLTIIEVMVATAILIIGLMSVLTHYATLQIARHETSNTAKVQDIVRDLVERISSAQPYSITIGTDTIRVNMGLQTLPWSLPRFENPAIPNDNPPIDEFSASPFQNLKALGLLQAPTGIADIKIYCEYYRGDQGLGIDGLPDPNLRGLIEDGLYTMAGQFRDKFHNDSTFVDKTRLVPDAGGEIDLVAALPVDDPYVIRVLATWENGVRKIESFTAKRRVAPQ